VSAEPSGAMKAYLEQHGLRVSRVVHSRTRPVPTPTVLAVDRAGVIRGVWMVQPDEKAQREILGTLAALPRG
jgi:hypothetical protein